MCKKILDNSDWYRCISPSLSDRFDIKFYEFVENAFTNGIITQKTWDYIQTEFPKIPTFYSLPKAHKSLNNPPGWPILSGKGALTENLSCLIDNTWDHMRSSLPSYIKRYHSLSKNSWKSPYDVFMIWDDPVDLLNSLLRRLNKKEFNLMFTMVHHSYKITFLDDTVSCDTNDMLKSCLFRKATAGSSLIHASSFHLNTQINSIQSVS